MVTHTSPDSSTLNDPAERRRRSAALWLGFHCGVGNTARLDELLPTLAAEIHPNIYRDLRTELQRQTDMNDPQSTSPIDEREAGLLLGKFASLCELGLSDASPIVAYLRLGRKLARSIACMARQENNAWGYGRVRECLAEIPPELVCSSETLSRLVELSRSRASNQELVETLVGMIPVECRRALPAAELPFHALYKLVSAAVSPNTLAAAPVGEAASPAERRESDGFALEPPPRGSEFCFGPKPGCMKGIASQMGMNYRTLKKQHGISVWIYRVRPESRKCEVYFRSRAHYENLKKTEA